MHNARRRKTVAALGLAALVLVAAHGWAAKGGKPKPPPDPADPADPAIVYVQATRTGDLLMVMNADGACATEIHRSSYLRAPSWSPDGKHVTYIDDYDIWRIDVAVVSGKPQGSNRVRLVDEPHVIWPSWSPLGDRILYCTLAFGGNSIMAVPASGGTPVTLYSGVSVGHPTWGPEGEKIAFVEGATIKVLDLDTTSVSTVLTLAEGARDVDRLEWARTQDVLILDEGYTDVIYTIDIATGAMDEVVGGAGPSWSPDDEKIVYTGRGLVTYCFSTGSIEKLAKAGFHPNWRR